MAAEWTLRGYRIDAKLFAALVGSRDAALEPIVIRCAKRSGVLKDPRLLKSGSFSTICREVVEDALEATHRVAYRIALEAFADATSLAYEPHVTYAIRDVVPETLKRVGLPTLARGLDRPAFSWPWRKQSPNVDWPSASYWDERALAACAKEIATAQTKGGIDARISAVNHQDVDPEDMTPMVRAVVGFVGAARKKIGAKKPRCVSGAADGLLVLMDGEQ